MISRTASYHTSIAHEQSLRRSFFDIHDNNPSFDAASRSRTTPTTPVSSHSIDHHDGSGSHEDLCQDRISRIVRGSKAVRRKNSLPHSRRGSLDTVEPPPPSRAGGTHLLPLRETKTLPFSKPSVPRPSADQEHLVQKYRKGCRKDYALGDTIRSQSHMIVEPTPRQAIQAVSSLSQHDFACVRRSDGSFSYAILAYRSMEQLKGETYQECYTFVMNRHGSTKRVRKRFWSDSVRLVCLPAPSFSDHASSISRESNPPVLCQDIESGGDRLTLPKVISFTADDLVHDEFGDDCSLMSSVSDRVRTSRRDPVR